MNERGGQGMDLEGVEVKAATMLSSPRRRCCLLHGGQRVGAHGSKWSGVAGARMASKGGARDGRAACATRGGGEATRKGESAAVELARAANRGGGGGLPREGEKRRLPVG